MFEDQEKKNEDKSKASSKPPGILPLMNTDISEKKLEAPKTSAHHLGPLANFEDRLNKLEARGRKRGRNFSIIGIIYSVIICTAVLISGYYIIKEINEFADQTQETITSITDGRLSSEHRLKIRPAWRSCGRNEDCVETKRECCDCQDGGRQSAINILYLNEWNQLIAEKCSSKVCVSESNCFKGIPLCENGYCIFKEATTSPNTNLPNCIAEGNTSALDGQANLECCSELKRVAPASEQSADGTCAMATGKFICLKCPDGVCDNTENVCNCPEDCSRASSTTSALIDADNDADGLTNNDEIKYGTDPNNPDSDADGYTDGDEVNKGFDPLGI